MRWSPRVVPGSRPTLGFGCSLCIHWHLAADERDVMEMIEGDPPKAVLFDLDGTLYELEPVRRRMGRALAINALLSPLKGPRTIKVLKAFRELREDLRSLGDGSPCLDDAQYAEPARKLGIDPDVVRSAVADWMLERPLPHLFDAGRTALRPILAALKGWDLPIGVFSDYPVEAKLAALGVDDMVDVTVCATEADVNAFKPHPRGFLVAAERMGVPAEEVVYVGDRVQVDAAGAAAAGMRCLVVGAAASGPHHVAVETFEEIPNVLGLG